MINYITGTDSDPAFQHNLMKLVDMGYDQDLVVRALSETDWDLESAIDKLAE